MAALVPTKKIPKYFIIGLGFDTAQATASLLGQKWSMGLLVWIRLDNSGL